MLTQVLCRNSAYGWALPTLAVQPVGSYPRQTGRDARVVATPAREPFDISRPPEVGGYIGAAYVPSIAFGRTTSFDFAEPAQGSQFAKRFLRSSTSQR